MSNVSFACQIKSRMRNKPQTAVAKIGCDDIRAVSLYLGDKQFLMGDRPTRVGTEGGVRRRVMSQAPNTLVGLPVKRNAYCSGREGGGG